MTYYRIITEVQLENWVSNYPSEARGTIVELVDGLVRTSLRSGDSQEIRFPKEIHEPGLDGSVNCRENYKDYIPSGISCWEIGTNKNPMGKIKDDYNKFLKNNSERIGNQKRCDVSLIFVVPRAAFGNFSRVKQLEWIRQKTEDGWKGIYIHDAEKICDWISEHPKVAAWMGKKMGLPVDDIESLEERWIEIQKSYEADCLVLQPSVFIKGREEAHEAAQRFLDENLLTLKLNTYDPKQVPDFCAAVVSMHSKRPDIFSKALIVQSKDALDKLMNESSDSVFILDWYLSHELDILSKIQNKGHRLIYAGVPNDSLKKSDSNLPIANLPEIEPDILERELVNSGYNRKRAFQLSRRCFGNTTNLRSLIIHPTIISNSKTASAQIPVLISAFFLGGWNEDNPHDKEIIAAVSQASFNEWKSEIIKLDSENNGLYFQKENNIWKVRNYSLIWSLVNKYITADHLQRYKAAILNVLGEIDPALDLPPEQRFAAVIYGKTPICSPRLKIGFASSLAFLGSSGELSQNSYDHFDAKQFVEQIVRELLDSNNWRVWVSLRNELPQFAEASPDAFLDIVTKQYTPNPSLIESLHENEPPSSFPDYTYDLIHSLKLLIKNSVHIIRVTKLLGDILEIDGKPYHEKAAFRAIMSGLNVRYPLPVVPTEKYKAAVTNLFSQHQDIGFTFLLEQLSTRNNTFDQECRPYWNETLVSEYAGEDKRSAVCIRILMAWINDHPEKLPEMLSEYPHLDWHLRYQLCEHLHQINKTVISDSLSAEIWDNLKKSLSLMNRINSKKEYYSQDEIGNLESISTKFEPVDIRFKYRHLFDARIFQPYFDPFSKEDEAKLAEHKAAISEVFAQHGVEGLIEFATMTEQPGVLGVLVSALDSSIIDDANILSFLHRNQSERKIEFIKGYISGKFRAGSWEWINTLHLNQWDETDQVELYLILPQSFQIWEFISRLSDVAEEKYWREVYSYALPMSSPENIRIIVSKCIQHKLPSKALTCIAQCLYQDKLIEPILILETMNQYPTPDQTASVYHFQKVLNHLSSLEDVDSDDVWPLEILYYPLYGYSDTPITAFERKVGSSAEFFCYLLEILSKTKDDLLTCEGDRDHINKIRWTIMHCLYSCRVIPGMGDDHIFNRDIFLEWYQSVQKRCDMDNTQALASSIIGSILSRVSSNPSYQHALVEIAKFIEEEDNEAMRNGFHTGIINNDGAHISDGIWQDGRTKDTLAQADAIDNAGYCKMSQLLRSLAEGYQRDKLWVDSYSV